jgi:hypothetical protein
MPQQTEPASPTLTASQASLPGLTEDPAQGSAPRQIPEVSQPHHIPRWLERIELFLRVMLRMYIGLAICYAPWSRAFWDQNPILLYFPAIANFAAIGAVRGIVSGLGLLNLWIAFQDALHYRNR